MSNVAHRIDGRHASRHGLQGRYSPNRSLPLPRNRDVRKVPKVVRGRKARSPQERLDCSAPHTRQPKGLPTVPQRPDPAPKGPDQVGSLSRSLGSHAEEYHYRLHLANRTWPRPSGATLAPVPRHCIASPKARVWVHYFQRVHWLLRLPTAETSGPFHLPHIPKVASMTDSRP